MGRYVYFSFAHCLKCIKKFVSQGKLYTYVLLLVLLLLTCFLRSSDNISKRNLPFSKKQEMA